MKGKVTKDIFLRVGQGVMRIPRNGNEPQSERQPFSPTQNEDDSKDDSSAGTSRRSRE